MVLSKRRKKQRPGVAQHDAAREQQPDAAAATAADEPDAAQLDEHALYAVCAAALAEHALALDATVAECVRESLLAELLDGALPRSEEALAARVDAVTAGFDDAAEELAELPHTLWRKLQAALRAARDAAEEASAGADALEDGCCGLCERRMPLTKHHLIPRSQHASYRAKGVDEATLARTLRCCRQCHSALHACVDEATLAAHYTSVEALLRHEGVHRFVAWASKQRGRADRSHHLQHKR
jgi:hypothetical protein